jgi:hypothetical protein
MFGLQTLSCLQEIPVVRSSTDKLQDVYAKAKDTSILIRLPLNLAEAFANKSLQIVLTIANPFVKPFSGPVYAIDDYAAQKIREIESKYPVINTSTQDVVDTFNEKTEPVRNVVNSVKDTTTSTIQQGKEAVSNVATATVNKASGVADSVYSFCETHVPGVQHNNTGKSTGLSGFIFTNVGSLVNYPLETVRTSLIWFRMLVVFFLLKTKQVNDAVLTKVQQKRFLTAFPQRLLIIVGSFLEYFIGQIRPDDRTLAEIKKPKQQPLSPQYFVNRAGLKPDPSLKTRQNVIVSRQEISVTRTSNSNILSQPQVQSDYSNITDNDEYTPEPINLVSNGDIEQLHAQIHPTDVELLYSRINTDTLPGLDNQEPLTEDQQQLHEELERQGYAVNENEEQAY